ncbi:SDR family oxidoreductase [Variovorax ureilyticus]|uniref:SDR family oxidoreductase n=1 Tax=Variovorax ureilyticus TaxID=1836198 RepID=A0ABU8VLU7_9BURK
MTMVDKVAIVTGAARGIGAAIATALAREGANVILTDVLIEEGEAMADQLRSMGYRARFTPLDVSDYEAWLRVVAEAEELDGGVDILVNNAGIQLRRRIADMEIAEWNRVFSINLNGALFGIKATTPSMKRRAGGSIVNIASISALGATPNVAYGTSKWAVRGLTRSAAFEYGRWNIRVNAVLPGAIPTELSRQSPSLDMFRKATPLGHLVTPEHVADVVVFLASEMAAGISGQDHVVDGGFTAGQHPGLAMQENLPSKTE